MAGRTHKPSGAPRRLGPPAVGEMRQLTNGEEIETGLTRSHLVFDGGPRGIFLFEPCNGGGRQRYHAVNGEAFTAAVEALQRYWSKRG